MNNPTERGTDDPTGYAPMVGMNDYEIVREAVLGMYSTDQDGLYGFKDDALAALDRIEFEYRSLADELVAEHDAWGAESENLSKADARIAELEAENTRYREALKEYAEHHEDVDSCLVDVVALSEEPA